MRPLGNRHWLGALAGALALHLCAAAAMLAQVPEQSARQARLGGIELSLGTPGVAPGAVAAAPPPAEAAEPSEADTTFAPPPRTGRRGRRAACATPRARS